MESPQPGAAPAASEEESPWLEAFVHAPVALALVRPDGVLAALNPCARRLLDVEPGEPLGAALGDEAARAELEGALQRALHGEAAGGEWWLGRRRARVRLQAPAGGRWVVASLEDVTEAQQREADLRHALGATADSLERVTDGFVALDADWRYTLVNSGGARLLGRTPEQLVGRHIWTEFPEGMGQPFHLAYERAFATQQPQTLLEYYPPFGRWFENRIYPSPDGLSIYFHDVTERVQTGQQLEALNAQLGRERQWLRGLLEQLPVAIALVRPGSGQLLLANALAARTLGALLEGRAPGEWQAEDGRPLTPETLPQVRAARGEVLDALGLACGERRWVVTSARIAEGLGHEATCVLAFQDVTELKRAEQALERSVRDRDEFLSIASHELKTPLAGLTLQVHRLLQVAAAPHGPGELARRAEPMRRSVARLDKLVQSLLDVSRIRSGRLALEREVLDLSELTREVLERLAEPLAQAGCALEARIAPQVVGFWDRLRLEQVLVNLVTNASKYGAGRPVQVVLDAEGPRARLWVSDQGIGIAAEEQVRIFEPFERAVSSRHYGGFGLGLWIVRQVVEALGGSVRVQSRPGEGATFVVELERAAS
nr:MULTISPECIES: ATP-binding protein [Myxococcaceae]